MRTGEKFEEEAADQLLQVAEWTYRSVFDYQASWNQIHPQDQQDWLQSCRDIASNLEQLERWRTQKKLSAFQTERYRAIEAMRRQAEPILEQLKTFEAPLEATYAHPMVLEG